MKLKDKVAIVTGAAGGIGRAHVLRLARLGADVVINDIDLEAYKKYGEKITEDSVVSTARLEKLLFSLPGKREQFLSKIALKRMATPDDISKGVEFFVTDLGDYVTGQCLSMCGGVIRF